MAKAKKLKSGSWRCLVYDYTDDAGKRHYKSFTCDDPSPKGKRKAEMMAAEYATTEKYNKLLNMKNQNITLGEAWDMYIENRSSVLSPGTVREYKRSRKTDLKTLMPMRLSDITLDDIQIAINAEALNHSAKTVRNIHGLLSAVMGTYRPSLSLKTDLPKPTRPELYIPSDAEIKILLKYLSGNEMEIPVLLAAFGPMRRGEICALCYEDIHGNTIHVHAALAQDENKQWVIKPPKTFSSDRYIEFPEFIIEKIGKGTGQIVQMSPNALSSRFYHILKNARLPHFRFHDLRHYSASIQHALGIPDVYIMQRGGWSSDATLKNVYRHAMDDQAQEMNNIANSHFENLCNTKCNTNIEK
jgi:integrase